MSDVVPECCGCRVSLADTFCVMWQHLVHFMLLQMCVFSRRNEFDIAMSVSHGRCCTACPSLHSSWYVCCCGRAIVLEVTTFHHYSTVKSTGNLGSFEWCLAVSVPIAFCIVWRSFVVLISCQVRLRRGGRGVVERVLLRSVAEKRWRSLEK